VLTVDNLFDGTISTSTEQFYIEPAHKYSTELPKSGVHSIIYKLSDVKMNIHNDHNNIDSTTTHEPHCASEKLFRKLRNEKLRSSAEAAAATNVNEKSDNNLNKLNFNDDASSRSTVSKRFKRWSPDEEVSIESLKINYVFKLQSLDCHKFEMRNFIPSSLPAALTTTSSFFMF